MPVFAMAQLQRVIQDLRLLFYALGIFLCYLLFGIFQEKITRTKYGPDGESFKQTMSLVFVQCVTNMMFARLRLTGGGADQTRVKHYVSCAFTYLTAMVASNMALQHVNYPTQVIGKSVKPIPVMILGVLYARKSYPPQKYLFTLMIVVGVALFVWKDGKSSGRDDGNLYGYTLLLVSLAMDGFTGAIQDRIRSEHEVRFAPLMYNINLWASLMLGCATLSTGELAEFVTFVKKYPIVMQEIIWFSILSALGQLFIYLTVADFGPLPCSVVTTTRKFFTVLASILYFGNPATTKQYAGTVLVFAGLALDAWKGKEQKKKHKLETPLNPKDFQ